MKSKNNNTLEKKDNFNVPKNYDKMALPYFKYTVYYYSSIRYFTFVVMGERGSGKKTLLDAFSNYLDDMNYEEPWKFKLVDENHIMYLHPVNSKQV